MCAQRQAAGVFHGWFARQSRIRGPRSSAQRVGLNVNRPAVETHHNKFIASRSTQRWQSLLTENRLGTVGGHRYNFAGSVRKCRLAGRIIAGWGLGAGARGAAGRRRLGPGLDLPHSERTRSRVSQVSTSYRHR